MRLFTVSLALAGLFAPQVQGTFRVHTYLIPAKMESRWITIEYNNPNCPPLKENGLGRELLIPESGFLCTSSPKYMGWYRADYYLVDEHKQRTALESHQRIHRREFFNVRVSSSGSDKTLCNVEGDEFFYGPKEKLTFENPIRKDEAFLKLHPGCRPPSRF